jgi:hypothetical protein
MKINWVLADQSLLDPTLDLERLKEIGSFWSGWQSWRSCQTDNVICSNHAKASELIQRDFHKLCNLYIPQSTFVTLDRPTGVRLFEGKFEQDVDHPDEIITMHLAASQSDIVLLLGFDWQPKLTNSDKLLEHRAQVYRQLVKHAIKENTTVQWVLIDHPENIMTELDNLDNFTQDTLNSVLSM